jgi:phospholipase/lecithinase/hemolysin
LLFLVLLAPATAWSQVNTKRSVSFGDSLTDNEYLFLLFGTDPLIYGADPFEAVFNQASEPDDTLTNHAVLGSTSADVLDQVLAYAESRWWGEQPPATLLSLQAGGNDFLTTEILLTLATAPPGESDAVDAIVNQIRRNLLKSLFLLQATDRRASVVVWTVPDVTLTPFVLPFGLDAQSLQNISLHIERLNQSIRLLGRQKRLAVLDISRVLTEVSLAPPTIDGVTLVPPPLFGFGAAVFADPIHPTAVSNGLLANELITTLNEKFDDQIPLYTDSQLGQLIGATP